MKNSSSDRAESTSSSGSSNISSSNNATKSKRQKKVNMNANQNSNTKVRPVTVEKVRRIVAQEGRAARNLISWNVPLNMDERNAEFLVLSENFPSNKTSGNRQRSAKKKGRSKSCDAVEKNLAESSKDALGRRARDAKPTSGTTRSSSASKKQISIRARYWAYLFDNLRRAVDEIYLTCENDESVVECKEVLLMLDNYRHEFQALIDWMNLQERLKSTDVQNRPTSLAWEVRKSSPGRPRQRLTPRSNHGGTFFTVPSSYTTPNAPAMGSNIEPSQHIKRSLRFPDGGAVTNTNGVMGVVVPVTNNSRVSAACATKSPTTHNSRFRSDSVKKEGTKTTPFNTVTWADRVKGVSNASNTQAPKTLKSSDIDQVIKKTAEPSKDKAVKDEQSDEEGWEKVGAKNRQPKVTRVTFKNISAGKNEVTTAVNNISCQKTGKQSGDQKVVADHNSNLIIDGKESGKTVEGTIEQCLDFFVDSVEEKSSCSAKETTLNTSFSNMVSERTMGTETFSSHSMSSSNSEKIKKIREPNDHYLDKVLFCDNDSLPENNISLQTLDDVEAEFLKSDHAADEDEACVLSSLEASESETNRALLAHDASIAAAEQQEQELMKEIEAEEQKTIESVETEFENVMESNVSGEKPSDPTDWSTIMARYDADQEQHAGMTWGDLMEEEEIREPGRAVQMHEKLSSPSRRSRTPAESKRKMEEKQRSATLRRQKMVQDNTERIHILTEKVMDVKKLKENLIVERRVLLQELHNEKLQRAEQKREMKLMKIVQRAQAEETKVNEILFINELQEQNKRHDVLSRILEQDARLQEIQQERFKMQEVKAAKEENVKERRRLLEKERQERLSELINRRREQDSRIEQLRLEKEKEREKLAKDKARDRELRLSALNAAQQEAVTELQKKIQLKHNESERRHQEQLEQRKEKALELSLGKFSLSSSMNLQSGEMQASLSDGEKAAQRITPSTSLDLSTIENSDDPTGGKGDAVTSVKNSPRDGVPSPRSGSTIIVDEKKIKEKENRSIERKRAMKKRAKKLKTRMATRSREFLKALDMKNGNVPSRNKNKVCRLVKDINRQLSNQKESSGPWPTNRVSALDRALGEIIRLLEKQDQTDKTMFRTSGGFEMVEKILELPLTSAPFHGQKGEPVPVIPDKSVSYASSAFKLACDSCYDNVIYVLYANRMTSAVDSLAQQLSKNIAANTTTKCLNAPRKPAPSSNITQESLFDSAAASLLQILAHTIGHLAAKWPTQDDNGKVHVSDDKTLLRALNISSMTSSKPNAVNVYDVELKRLLDGYINRGLDTISYVVSSGVLDELSKYLGSVRSEVEANSKESSFIRSGLFFLSSVTDFVTLKNRLCSESAEQRSRRSSGSNTSSDIVIAEPRSSLTGEWDSDPTQLLPTLYHTELMGVVSVLYGILIHGAPERPTLLRNKSNDTIDDITNSNSPLKKIPIHVLQIALSVFRVLNAVADMDIHLMQASLGAEGVSLEFRHICTFLLWYCQHGEYDALLHEVIISVGHFALCNRKNQDTAHSGAMPTVLQQLCVLPFAYFSNPRLTDILFPTLIACCHDNRTNLAMLEQEASGSLLSGYIQNIFDAKECEDNDKASKDEKSAPHSTHNSLSSSVLYTKTFLRDALRFFQCDENRRDDDVVVSKIDGDFTVSYNEV